jgi:hypothetical protein
MFSLFEGGRFKKEVIIDGQSYLLLIRDEGGSPELQVGLYLVHKSDHSEIPSNGIDLKRGQLPLLFTAV